MRTIPLCLVAVIPASACIGVPTFDLVPADAELLANVEGIRKAEIAVQAVDDFLPCSDASAAQAATSGIARAWDGPDCFARLGWAPSESVRGGYFVEVSADKSDFKVVGLADVDGDGVFMRVEASKSQAARVVSPEGVL